MHIKDLNITTDILQLFNFTQNEDAKTVLHNLITMPLHTEQEVVARQDILKGFIANIAIYRDYSYSRIDYREVYTFLETFEDSRYLPKWAKTKLFFSRKKNYEYRGKCVQLILLYHRLHSRYIRNINLAAFPEEYKQDIREIDNYFNSFRLDYYENLIRTNALRIKHFIQIMKIISERKKRRDIEQFQKRYMLFEAYLSISQGIYKHNFSFPEIGDSGVELKNFYHPLVKNAVKNSLSTLLM
jgi:DNA mismatch repair protein MutS